MSREVHVVEERGKTTVVSVRFTSEEFARLRAIAERDGVSVSAVVRRSVLAQVPGSGIAGSAQQPTPTGGMAFVGAYTTTSGSVVAAVSPPRSNMIYPAAAIAFGAPAR